VDKQGAKWAIIGRIYRVKKMPVPDVKMHGCAITLINYTFKIRRDGLTPSPVADKATLLRRVSLDLKGVRLRKQVASHFLKEMILKKTLKRWLIPC